MHESAKAVGRADRVKISPFALEKGELQYAAERSVDNEAATCSDQPARGSSDFRDSVSGEEGAPQASPNANGQRQLPGLSALLRAPENGSSGAPSPRATATGGIAAALRDAVMRRTTGNASQDESVVKEFANGDSYSGHWKLDLVGSCAIPCTPSFYSPHV